MSIVPVSSERHRDLRWTPFADYSFARSAQVASVVLAELPRAILSLPIGFLRGNEVVQPVALLGLRPEENLFVGADGRWLGPYVPAAFRGYPFRLLPLEGDSRMALCVDESSGLIGADEGEPFFGPDGQPAERVRKVVEFLSQVENNRQATIKAAGALDAAGLLVPWPIELQEGEKRRRVEGLWRVDEEALNRLEGAALASLRDVKALALAYMSLVSMQHLALLVELLKRKNTEEARLQSVFEKSFSTNENEHDLTFDWSALPEPPTRQ